MGTRSVKREPSIPPDSERIKRIIAAAIRALPFGEEIFGELPLCRRSNCGVCVANFEVFPEGTENTQSGRPRILITFSRAGSDKPWKLFDIEVSGFKGRCEFLPSQLPKSAQIVGTNTIYLFESSLNTEEVRLAETGEMAISAA